MKELSIEEKARAYDEAIAHAKILLKIIGNATLGNLVLKNEFGNMFPELKESEDENIRKALIHFFSNTENTSFEYWEGIPKSKVISWLEKQAEHANFRNKIQIGDKVTRNEDGVLVNLSQLKRVAKKQSEQKLFARYKVGDTIYYDSFGRLVSFTIANIVEDGTDNPMYEDKDGNSVFQSDIVEQKPADNKGMNIDEESMTPFQKKVFCIIDTAIEEEQGLKQVCDELLRLAHDEIIQKFAWSEEDEKMYNVVHDLAWESYKTSRRLDIPTFGIINDWLKSLKDRVQPQTKQEWSEENQCMLNNVIDTLKPLSQTTHSGYAINSMINWLKSLRPQNTWKPSDEQMEQLNIVSTGKGYFDKRPLKEMYEQLKKLKL